MLAASVLVFSVLNGVVAARGARPPACTELSVGWPAAAAAAAEKTKARSPTGLATTLPWAAINAAALPVELMMVVAPDAKPFADMVLGTATASAAAVKFKPVERRPAAAKVASSNLNAVAAEVRAPPVARPPASSSSSPASTSSSRWSTTTSSSRRRRRSRGLSGCLVDGRP